MIRKFCILAVCTSLALCARAQTTITAGIFTFDYSLDGSSGLFAGTNGSSALTTLQLAGQYVSNFVSTTTLSAITPGGSNTWQPQFYNPSNFGSGGSLPGGNATPVLSSGTPNMSLQSSSIYVYVGSSTLGAFTTATSVQGTYTSSSDSTWQSTLANRGNGSFSMPWGGSMAFNGSSSWYFDTNTSFTAGDAAGANDFFGVAVHELFHVLGFGLSSNWTALRSGLTFTGPNAAATGYYNSSGTTLTAGPIPLANNSHWADNSTYSFIAGTSTLQETMMDPSLTTGTRKFATSLDLSALQDIGYTVVSPIPEPADSVAIVAAVGLLFAFGRRIRAKRRETVKTPALPETLSTWL
jgi:hypothetical protein